MSPRTGFARSLPILILAGLMMTCARAQNALFAEYDGRMARVIKLSGSTPLVGNGKGGFARADRSKLLLHADPEYLPEFVFINDVQATVQRLGESDSNSRFTYHAVLVSPFALKDAFIVLDVTMRGGLHSYALWEVGDLESYQPHPFQLTVTTTSNNVDTGNYFTHVFSNGREVFNTSQGWPYIDDCVDKMIQKRIAGVVEAKPHAYFGPPLEITSKLRGRKGRVVVRCTIDAHGRVVDPEVKNATDPDLGEVALGAVRLWRFFPKIVAGAPVATTISIPFDFPP